MIHDLSSVAVVSLTVLFLTVALMPPGVDEADAAKRQGAAFIATVLAGIAYVLIA